MLCDVVCRRRRRRSSSPSSLVVAVVRRRRRWAHPPVIHAASHFDHKKRVAWVPISMHTCGSFFYNNGAPLGGPSGHRSSAKKMFIDLTVEKFHHPRLMVYNLSIQLARLGQRLVNNDFVHDDSELWRRLSCVSDPPAKSFALYW